MVLARTQQPVEGGTWLVEGKAINECSVLVAQAVVSPCNDTVIVHLLNPHTESITLHGKTTIAYMEKLDAVCIVTDATKRGKAMEPDPETSREKEHLLWEIKCSPGLSEGEQNQFYQLLLSYSDIFADTGSDIGRTNRLKHTIFTGEIQPIHQPARHVPPHRKVEVSKLLQEMLEKDIIEQSNSSWASPVVLCSEERWWH